MNRKSRKRQLGDPMRSKLREIKRKSKRCHLGIEWSRILVFLEQHCLIPANPVLLLMVPPLTHKSIPVWTITFISSYQKVKLGKECFRKISSDGLKVKRRKGKGNELRGDFRNVVQVTITGLPLPRCLKIFVEQMNEWMRKWDPSTGSNDRAENNEV